MKKKNQFLKFKIFFTKRCQERMKYYKISESRVKRIVNSPERKEKGIIKGTIAMVQTVGKKEKTEIWVLCQKRKNKIKVISVWRYPKIKTEII